jgi:hypothetical protein
MSTSIIDEPDLALDRHDGNIFVVTMRKGPENRLNSAYCQKLIGAFNLVRTSLGPDSEGAVITKGNDAKFWCTVSLNNLPVLVLTVWRHDLISIAKTHKNKNCPERNETASPPPQTPSHPKTTNQDNPLSQNLTNAT